VVGSVLGSEICVAVSKIDSVITITELRFSSRYRNGHRQLCDSVMRVVTGKIQGSN